MFKKTFEKIKAAFTRKDRDRRQDHVVGIFEEKEGHKSMTRVLSFMTTTTACAIIVMQEVANLLIADYETNIAAPSLLLGYSAGKKLTQKHFETRHIIPVSEEVEEEDEEVVEEEIADGDSQNETDEIV